MSLEYLKLFKNMRAQFEPFDDAECGRIFRAMMDYAFDGKEPSFTGNERFAWPSMKQYIDMCEEKNQEISEKRSASGRMGGRPKKQQEADDSDEKQAKAKKPNAFFEKQKNQTKPNETKKSNDKDYDKDYDYDYDQDQDYEQDQKENELRAVLDDESSANIIDITQTRKQEAQPKQSKTEERFTKFWAAYPKKVGKKEALKAFEKAKVDDALLGKILIAIKDAKNSAQWQKDDGQYIPNPSTWLNQGRWDDELTPARDTGQQGSYVPNHYIWDGKSRNPFGG